MADRKKPGSTAHRPYRGGDPMFERACNLAGTPTTNRQYRKWLQKRGKAAAFVKEAAGLKG
jgi:hypothetical protein